MSLYNLKSWGPLPKGHSPKVKRPLDRRLAPHLVIKSSQAKGLFSMRHPSKFKHVNELVSQVASWPKFIQELTGRLVHFPQGRNGQEKSPVKFGDHRHFTSIVRGGFRQIREYIFMNDMEATFGVDRRQRRLRKELIPILDG